jgi:hypothetical protein
MDPEHMWTYFFLIANIILCSEQYSPIHQKFEGRKRRNWSKLNKGKKIFYQVIQLMFAHLTGRSTVMNLILPCTPNGSFSRKVTLMYIYIY